MAHIVRAEERRTGIAGVGPLRSFVDVSLSPGQGFSTHHHRNVEVVTLVLAGEMTHKDARDQVTVIPAGSVHRLSAGIGVTHAEYNLGETPARFLQITMEAEIRGVRPEEGLLHLPSEAQEGNLFPIASGDDRADSLLLYQDATIYLTRVGAGRVLAWAAEADRVGYLYVYEGLASMDGRPAGAGDAALIPSGDGIELRGEEPVSLVLLDLPA